MINPRTLLLSMILALVAVNSASATSYYVTQSGSGGTCTSAPIGTPMSVATFNGCSSGPTGGDTVFFTGTITSTVTPNRSGTGNGAGRLTLDMSAATMTPPIITFSGDSYITVLGGSVAAGSDGVTLVSCSLPLTSSHDITVSNFTFTGISGGTDAFVIVGGCSNLTLSGNTIDNIQTCVNQYQGSQHDITILNNYCRTSVNTVNQTDVINLGDTINVTIQGNKLINRAPGSQSNSRHNDIIQTYQGGGSSNQSPSNWVIRYNWIEEAVTDCADTDGSNSWTMIENTSGTNYEYGNVFYTTSPCQFGNGATMDSNASTVVWNVANNTYYGSAGYPGIWFQNSGHLNISENNAFQLTSSSGTILIFDWTNGTLDYNYFSGISGCGTTPVGTHGMCSASLPMFVNVSSGNMAPTSTLINKGDSSIGATYNQGICPGATWPNPTLCTRSAGAWDAGAYQSGNGGPTAPKGLALVVH